VGGKSFKRKKKRNWVGGEKKIKFQKKIEIRGKFLGKGRGENKVGKKKLRSGLIKVEKGQRKKSTQNGMGIEKIILSVHHPSMLVHWWVLVHFGHSLWLCEIHGKRVV
jgi:hypothetical protein